MGGVATPLEVLVVCTGNLCRSPVAERLLADRLGGRHTVRSAGVHGLEGADMDPYAAAELARRGASPAGFRSRRLCRADVQRADLVLTMTTAHRSVVLAEEPAALSRTFTLKEFAHLLQAADAGGGADATAASIGELARRRSTATLDDYDVVDPIGEPAHVHAEVAAEIEAAVDVIAARLGRSSPRLS